jgi:hypothetical protein
VDRIEVSVKVAVSVVVSWTVIPKQDRNSLKLTVDIPQLPTEMTLFRPLIASCRILFWVL